VKNDLLEVAILNSCGHVWMFFVDVISGRALYGPSFGVDNGERAVYPETESTVNEKIQDCDVNHLQKYTPGNGENQEVTIDKGKCIDKPLRSKGKGKGHTTHGKTKKRKNDQYVGGSVVEIYLQVSAQFHAFNLIQIVLFIISI
jgi:hypothetical protein